MSMWLKLIPVDPSFVAEVEACPDLLDRLWFEDDPGDDVLEERLGFGGAGDADDLALAEFWTPEQTWLAPAVGIGAGRLPYECTYGLAWFHPAPDVTRIAGGLSNEVASFPQAPGPDDRERPYVDIARSVAAFYGRAADERKAVIGGLT
jgi:hypothetical protein